MVRNNGPDFIRPLYLQFSKGCIWCWISRHSARLCIRNWMETNQKAITIKFIMRPIKYDLKNKHKKLKAHDGSEKFCEMVKCV